MSSGRLILPIAEPILTATGEPDGGATLTVYNTGTTTLAAIFADAGLTTAVQNPQTANQAGRFYEQTTVLWADASIAYDALITLTDGSSLTFSDIYVLGLTPDTSTFAPIASPNFTGTPTAPTPSLADSSGKIATTAYVQGQGYAGFNSPAFTGTPTAPTAAAGTNTTQIATTAFVQAQKTTSALFQFQEPSGTNGSETMVSGWNQRVLNTTVSNNIPSCSLAANQVTLPIGTYVVSGFAVINTGGTNNDTRVRVRNATAGATLITGGMTFMNSGQVFMALPFSGMFALSTSSAIEIDTWQNFGGTPTVALSTGEPEVFASITIQKIA